MTIGEARLIELAHLLTSREIATREDACGTVTDWMGSLSKFEVRTIGAILSSASVVETDESCRESQLHALYELVDTGSLTADVVAPIRRLDLSALGVSEREYVNYLREEFLTADSAQDNEN